MGRLVLLLLIGVGGLASPGKVLPPNDGRGAGTVPIWNSHRPTLGNPPLTVRVLALNYAPRVAAEGGRKLWQVFGWNDPAQLAEGYREAMEYASGGHLRFELVEWRELDEIYAQEDGYRYTVEEYVRNRRAGTGWREGAQADYPRLLREQGVVPLVDRGLVDEVWIFGDHFFGLWEASMAGPGAFFINGGVYPEVPSRRPFAFFGFNYERGVAEMMHDACHRTECTLNRVYGLWNLEQPRNPWERFSAHAARSGDRSGVGNCHWPANAGRDYDYANPREVMSWADGFLRYPEVDWTPRPVSRETWSRGPDYHLDYMKWYFAHVPRAGGVNADGRQNNWFKYVFDYACYDQDGRPLPPSAELLAGEVADAGGRTHIIHVAYRAAEQIDEASLGDDDLSVTDADGRELAVRLAGGADPGGRSYRVVRYEVTSPRGTWGDHPAGPYRVTLRRKSVRTRTGTAVPAERLGAFRVGRLARR